MLTSKLKWIESTDDTNVINYSMGQKDFSSLDYNSSKVNLVDTKTPLVIFVGPSGSGKTRAVCSLLRYLWNSNYYVQFDSKFGSDVHYDYEELCRMYCAEFLDRGKGIEMNVMTYEILFDVYKNYPDQKVVRILDSPSTIGWSHNDSIEPLFPDYMNDVLNFQNKKIFIFTVEASNWIDTERRNLYVENIKYVMNKFMSKADKAIVLYSKVNELPFEIDYESCDMQLVIHDCNDKYHGLLDLFKRKSIYSLFLGKYKCPFVPYVSLDRYLSMDEKGCCYNKFEYRCGSYQQRLWKAINKFL